MAERFKAVDCKSIEFSHRRFESYFLLKISRYSAVGSAPVLGTGGHVFKSHYFEIIFFLLTGKSFLNACLTICASEKHLIYKKNHLTLLIVRLNKFYYSILLKLVQTKVLNFFL